MGAWRYNFRMGVTAHPERRTAIQPRPRISGHLRRSVTRVVKRTPTVVILPFADADEERLWEKITAGAR